MVRVRARDMIQVGIVMEYLGGGSLEDLVKAGGCQDEANLANMAAQILKVEEAVSCSVMLWGLARSRYT